MNSVPSIKSLPSEPPLISPTLYGPRLFLECNADAVGEFGSEQLNGGLIPSLLDVGQDVQNISIRIDNYRRGSYPIRVTVEDILGLEKYGVFAVAANTVAMFPLPGVRDCIRQKQAVTRITENFQEADAEIRIKASISRIISVPSPEQQGENGEVNAPPVCLPSYAFALDAQAPSDLSPLFYHMKSYQFQVMECSEAFKQRWTRKLSITLIPSGNPISAIPLSQRLHGPSQMFEEFTQPSSSTSLTRFYEAEAGRKAALRKIANLTDECNSLHRENDHLEGENKELRKMQTKLIAEMNGIKEDQMQKRLRIYTQERDIRALEGKVRELSEVRENVKEEEEVAALILRSPGMKGEGEGEFSFAMAGVVAGKRKPSNDGGRTEAPRFSGGFSSGSFTSGPFGGIAPNGRVPTPFKFARGMT